MKIAEVALKYKTHVPVDDMAKIECPDDAAIILRSIWDEDTIQLREEFVVILLNPRINADRPHQFLPASLFIVTLSFVNNFKMLAPVA